MESFELIIINDSSQFTVQNIEKKIGDNFGKSFLNSVVLLDNKGNFGVAISRNNGLDIAKGMYLHVLDQDDEIEEDFYLIGMKEIQESDFVLMNGYFVNEKSNLKHLIFYFKPNLKLENFILDDFVRSPGQVFFKKNLTHNCRFISPKKYKGADDRFFWILLYGLNPNLRIKFVSKPLYIAHLHGENYSNNSRELYLSCKELWEAIPKEIFSSQMDYIRRNKLAINYVLKEDKSLLAFIEYLRYKYKPNRLLRYIVKHTFAKW